MNLTDYIDNWLMDMQKLLDSLLEAGLEEGCYPGAAAACGCKDEVFAISTVGKIADDRTGVDRYTRYDMASLTKLLAPTMLAFQALEKGDLTLWDTLERYFDDVPQDKADISIFHLMTHTSGLEPSLRLERFNPDPAQAMRVILESKLLCRPGTEPNYSCMGYITLGKILERIYGEPLNVLAEKRVFAPLGMQNTGYLPKGSNIAATEIDPDTGKALQGVVHDENARFLGGVSGNAGVFSDIEDMIKFARMLSKGGDDFINPAIFRKALVNYTPQSETHRGLGFHLLDSGCSFMGDLFPEGSFGHTGFTGTSLVVDPSTGFYVIILSNRVHPTRENLKLMRFRRRAHNVLYAAFCAGSK